MDLTPIREAEMLLNDQESDIPEPVRRTVSFLAGHGLWFKLSRNKRATSCPEAAQRRSRLGKVGIPLWDEMKSAAYEFIDASGSKGYVFAHCRGDRLIEEESVLGLFNSDGPIKRLEQDQLSAVFQMGYGIVNPFFESSSLNVVQVFDEDIIKRIGVPGTCMTNAGDYLWGVEFFVDELVEHLDRAQIASISKTDPRSTRRVWGVRDQKQIAIITGNAPESGMLLWELLNEHVRRFLGVSCSGDVSMPPVSVFSVPEMGLSMELSYRHEQTWNAIRRTIMRACVGGCNILAIACNTTQYFKPQIEAICNKWNVEFVFIPESVENYLRLLNVKRAKLLSIGYVADMSKWSAFRDVRSVEIIPSDENDVKQIEEVAFKVKQGENVAKNIRKLESILNKPDKQSEKSKKPIPIIIALTELSIILRESKIWQERGAYQILLEDRIIIDSLAVYAGVLASKFLEIEFRDLVNPIR